MNPSISLSLNSKLQLKCLSQAVGAGACGWFGLNEALNSLGVIAQRIALKAALLCTCPAPRCVCEEAGMGW